MGSNTEYIKLETIEKNEWDRIREGGGGGSALPVYVPFVVTVDEEAGAATVSTTAKFADVKAAVVAKKNVIAEIALYDSVFYAPLVIKKPSSDPGALGFGGVYDFAGHGEPAEPTHIIVYLTSVGSSIYFNDLALATE